MSGKAPKNERQADCHDQRTFQATSQKQDQITKNLTTCRAEWYCVRLASAAYKYCNQSLGYWSRKLYLKPIFLCTLLSIHPTWCRMQNSICSQGTRCITTTLTRYLHSTNHSHVVFQRLGKVLILLQCLRSIPVMFGMYRKEFQTAEVRWVPSHGPKTAETF